MTFARLARMVRQRLRSWLWKSRADAELNRELDFHFDQLVQENLAGGMSAGDARRAARRTLGNIGLLEEQCRDHRRAAWLHDLKQDVLYGWRTMRNNPGFTAIAAASLALGIGANTAILGAADAMLFGKLPYRDASRIVMIRTFPFENPGQFSNASLPDFFAFKEQTRSFEAIGCSLADQKNLGAGEGRAGPVRAFEGPARTTEPVSAESPRVPVRLEGRAGPVRAPEKLFGQAFSPGLFETLGVQPLLGRTFSEADYGGRPPSVVVLSYRLWQSRFGADPKILGQHVRLNGASTEIVGVMPPDFRFAEERPDYWVPMQVTRSPLQAGVRYFVVAARLRNGVTAEQAQAELNHVAAQLAADFPESHQGWGARLQPMREALFGWTRKALITLEAAVWMVLAIACANVAGLLLARGASRRREVAMRAALGAARVRIVRQMLAESLMLASIGGLLGLAIARAALHALPAIPPPPYAPRLEEIPMNSRMLLLTALTSAATGLIFGIGPALAAFRQDLTAALKESSRGSGNPLAHQRFRGALVAGQIALAFVLLIGSGLLMKSFARMAGRDLNFDPHGLITFEFRLPMQQFEHVVGSYHGFPYMAVDAGAAPKFQRILERLRRLPGAESVAGISSPPVNSLIVPRIGVTVESGGAVGDSAYFLVTPGFFRTIRAPVVRGRNFETSDTPGAVWVAVVNETAARRFWPGEDPIGKRFTLDTVPDDRPREVIGVVRDIPTSTRQTSAEPAIYASYLQQPSRYRLPWSNLLGQMMFVLRSPGDPRPGDQMTLAPEIQNAVAEIDPEVPLSNIETMDRYTDAWSRSLFYYALTLGVFAFLAALLAAMGAYGVMAYAVAQRTREIGIRVALGARPLQVFGLVARETMLLVGIGLAGGFAGAIVLARPLASQLWEVAPTDPEAFAGAFLLLALAAGIACVGPLRRCVRMNPVLALRGE